MGAGQGQCLVCSGSPKQTQSGELISIAHTSKYVKAALVYIITGRIEVDQSMSASHLINEVLPYFQVDNKKILSDIFSVISPSFSSLYKKGDPLSAFYLLNWLHVTPHRQSFDVLRKYGYSYQILDNHKVYVLS